MKQTLITKIVIALLLFAQVTIFFAGDINPEPVDLDETQFETVEYSGETITKPKSTNIFQKGVKTVKSAAEKYLSGGSKSDTSELDMSDFGYDSMSGLTGGAGSVNVSTGDIYIKDVVGNIDVLKYVATECNNVIGHQCGDGSVCNVTTGPCVVKTGQKGLNAAPTDVVFSRYLSANPIFSVMVNESRNGQNQKVPLELTKKTNYTSIIQYNKNGMKNISYMFIALPTNSKQVDMIKNLPLGLGKYLKTEKGSIVKIYRSLGNSSSWNEISQIKTSADHLDDKILTYTGIVSVEITGNGDLAVSYRNLKNRNGKKIPLTRVVYTHFTK